MEYIYHKNIFGDIVAIYQGATKVAEYAYDAYGRNFIKVDIDGIATSNPFRYRGYYWDSDLSLYYLMSRYYDPATSRFINTDSLEYLDPESIHGLNLFAYCGNNPVMNVDPLGTEDSIKAWVWLGLATIVAIAFVVGSMYIPATSVLLIVLSGTLSGAGSGFLSGAVSNIFAQIQAPGFESVDPKQALIAGVQGAFVGAVTGALVGFFAYSLGVTGKSLGTTLGYDLSNSMLSRTIGLGVGFYAKIGEAVGIISGAMFGITASAKIIYGEDKDPVEAFWEAIEHYIEEKIAKYIERWKKSLGY